MASKKPTVKRSSPTVKRSASVSAAAPAVRVGTSAMVGEVAGQLAAAASAVSAVRRASRAPQPSAAVSTDLVSELNNIDFRKMIGGPLQAAVDAQVASSLATVDFIKKVGFSVPLDASGNPDTTATPKLVMVDFTHTRTDAGDPTEKTTKISVPLLAMLPIPSLRIEHVIIDFNVKLNSVESSHVEDQLGVNAEVKGGWGPVSMKVSVSYQRKTATNVEVKKEYSLNVNVKAVQDEIPAGLEKILNMLAA